VRGDHAQLGVLLDRGPGEAQVRMLLVGTEGDQAVIAIERIEDRPAPDIDRSLAIKVRDALELIIAVDAARSAAAPAEPEARKAPTMAAVLTRRAPAPASDKSLRVLLEAGGAFSWGTYQRAVGQFALGLQTRRAHYYGEGLLAAQVISRLSVREPEGTVREDEWGGALSLRAGRSTRRLGVGVYGELGVSRISAIGTTSDDTSGTARLWLFRGTMGVDLRVTLAPGIALRFAPAVELFPVAQRFAIDGRVTVDLGRARAIIPLSLVLALSRPGASVR
jgi:hypothetical protein